MILGYGDRVSLVSSGSISSNVAWDLAPLSRLQSRQLGAFARTSAGGGGPSTLTVGVDLGDFYPIRLMALLGCAGFFQCSLNASNTTVFGTDAWSGIGFPLALDAASPAHFILPIGTTGPVTARYVSFGLTFYSAPRIGRFWASPAFESPEGIEPEWRMGVEDTGTGITNPTGAYFPRFGARLNTLTARFGTMDRVTALALRAALRALGSTGSALGIARPFNDQWGDAMITESSVYGRMTDALDVTHNDADIYSADLRMIEER